MARRKRKTQLLDRIELLADFMSEVPEAIYHHACEIAPPLHRVPLWLWHLHAGAAMLYAASFSVSSYLTAEEQDQAAPAFNLLITNYAVRFGDVRAEMAAIHAAVLKVGKGRRVARSPADMEQDLIVQLGVWPLSHCLKWKRVPAKYQPLIAVVGNLIWTNLAPWFNPKYDPAADGPPPGDLDLELPIKIMATVSRLNRQARNGSRERHPRPATVPHGANAE